MSISSLVDYVKLSPNCTTPRNHVIDTISIHCMAGNLSVESCGAMFAQTSRQASSNYGIDSTGRIALYVDESNRSWCTSSRSNDHRAITIEVANTVAKDPWPISDKAYEALINLLVDICQRNSIKQLLWQGDKSLIGQVERQNMTVHRWFANKACPGDYLYNMHGQIAQEVNKRLEESEVVTYEQWKEYMDRYRAEHQDNDASSYSEEARTWAQSAGIVQGNNGAEFNGMWEDFLTREQFVTVLHRFAKAAGIEL